MMSSLKLAANERIPLPAIFLQTRIHSYLLCTEFLCPLKFPCWSPNPQSNGIWRWSAHNRMSVLTKKGRETRDQRAELALSSMWGPSKSGSDPSPEKSICHALILNFQPPEPWAINACCVSHSIYLVSSLN